MHIRRMMVVVTAMFLCGTTADPVGPLVAAGAEGKKVVETRPSCIPSMGTAGSWFQTHEQQLRSSARKDIRVAMVGDSIVAGWDTKSWEKYWAPRGAFNFGIPADRTEHVLWRIKEGMFDDIDPDVVVLEIGTNNLKSGDVRRSPEETVAGIRAIVEAIRGAQPGARIIVMAIFPRQPQYESMDAAVRETNARLCALQREMEEVRVVDIGAFFLGEDLKPGKTYLGGDMLHLNAAGYELWSQCIVDVVDAGLAKGKARGGDETGAKPATEAK